MKQICVLIVLLGLNMSFSSCSIPDSGPGLVKFSITAATFGESDEVDRNVSVSISTKQSADVTVTWSYLLARDTYLDGDFSFPSTGAITIAAGQTSGHIVIHVINDTQIDADDNITLTLTAVTGNAKLSASPSDLKYVAKITNDDTTPSDAMQADLTWSTGEGTSIDNIDLNLYLQYNVVINSSTGHVDDIGTTYDSSLAVSGFESLWLETGDTDQDYFLAVQKASAAGAADFTLTINGFGWNAQHDGNSFVSTDPQYTSFFYGPFAKSGSDFLYTGRSRSLVPKNGKILCYKVDNFPGHPNADPGKH